MLLGKPSDFICVYFSSVRKTWLVRNSTCTPYKLKVNRAEVLTLSPCHKSKLSWNFEHTLLLERSARFSEKLFIFVLNNMRIQRASSPMSLRAPLPAQCQAHVCYPIKESKGSRGTRRCWLFCPTTIYAGASLPFIKPRTKDLPDGLGI